MLVVGHFVLDVNKGTILEVKNTEELFKKLRVKIITSKVFLKNWNILGRKNGEKVFVLLSLEEIHEASSWTIVNFFGKNIEVSHVLLEVIGCEKAKNVPYYLSEEEIKENNPFCILGLNERPFWLKK